MKLSVALLFASLCLAQPTPAPTPAQTLTLKQQVVSVRNDLIVWRKPFDDALLSRELGTPAWKSYFDTTQADFLKQFGPRLTAIIAGLKSQGLTVDAAAIQKLLDGKGAAHPTNIFADEMEELRKISGEL